MLLTWGIDQSAEVSTVEELDELLDHLATQARDQGMIVQAATCSGRTLAIGLGREESVLTYFDDNGDSFTSVGVRDREDYLSFEFGGDISEFLGAKAVPESAARAAAREFFKEGKRPELVQWEKEWA